MGLSPRAFGLGPLETIVNVGWGGQGFTISISATSAYNVGTPGSRSASLSLTDAGRRAGGVIISQETVDAGGFFTFSAEINFKTNLGISEALFDLRLTGAITIPQEGSNPPLVPPFCGTKTVTSNTTAPYKVPNPFIPGGFQFFSDTTVSVSSPAGSSGSSWTNGPLAGGRELETAGAVSISGTAQTIWYQDDVGNWVDTGLSCDQLGTPEGPDPNLSNRIEGFGIAAQLFDGARGGMVGPHQTISMGPKLIGLNGDFVPIFDQLPDNTYSFAAQRLIIQGIPPTTLPNGNLKPTQSMVMYPVTGAEYSTFIMRDDGEFWAPPEQTIPGEIPPGSTLIEKTFPPGGAPPANTGYIHRP